MIANGSVPDSADAGKTVSGANSVSTSGEEYADNESKSGNLLSLVQPELVNLAHYWLAALRDHALLSLPPGNICLY